MSILETTEAIRKRAREFGQYRFVSKQCGVGFDWLAKFAVGSIPNPTVANVARIEAFLNAQAANQEQAGLVRADSNDLDQA